jgi:predicted phage-related endonuclease
MRGIPLDRLSYVGGSDARTFLGKDENALLRLWQEKRGEIGREDLSGNLLVQFGCATEELNRRWFEPRRGTASARSSASFATPSSNGWGRP